MSGWFYHQPIQMPWRSTAMRCQKVLVPVEKTTLQILSFVARQYARRASFSEPLPVRALWAAVAVCMTALAAAHVTATDFFTEVERDRVNEAMRLGNYQGALDLVVGYEREFEDMRKKASKAEIIEKRWGFRYQEASMHLLRANALRCLGRYDDAKNAYDFALQDFKKIEDELWKRLIHAGSVARHREQVWLEMRDWANTTGRIRPLVNAGRSFNDASNQRESLLRLLWELVICHAAVLDQRGTMEMDRGNLNAAERYFRGGLKLREILGDGRLSTEMLGPHGSAYATVARNFARLYLKKGDLERAEEYLRLADDRYKEAVPDADAMPDAHECKLAKADLLFNKAELVIANAELESRVPQPDLGMIDKNLTDADEWLQQSSTLLERFSPPPTTSSITGKNPRRGDHPYLVFCWAVTAGVAARRSVLLGEPLSPQAVQDMQKADKLIQHYEMPEDAPPMFTVRAEKEWLDKAKAARAKKNRAGPEQNNGKADGGAAQQNANRSRRTARLSSGKSFSADECGTSPRHSMLVAFMAVIDPLPWGLLGLQLVAEADAPAHGERSEAQQNKSEAQQLMPKSQAVKHDVWVLIATPHVSVPDLPQSDVDQELSKRVTANYEQVPFREIVSRLNDLLGTSVQLDWHALEDFGFDLDAPVTLQVTDVSLATCLRLLGAEMDLTFRVSDDEVAITTVEDAISNPLTRTYDVSDLVSGSDDAAEQFASLLRHVVAVGTWKHDGAWGSVGAYQNDNSTRVVVRQVWDAHEELRDFLNLLRYVKAMPVAERRPIAQVGYWSDSCRGLRRVLDTQVDVDLEEVPLNDAIAAVAAEVGLVAYVEQAALEDALIDGATWPISLAAKKRPLVQVLNQMLSPLDLAWMTHGRALVITTAEEDQKKATAAFYPADFIVGKERAHEKLKNLAEVLQANVTPDMWDSAGGPAALFPVAGDLTGLVIRHTANGHREVDRFLRSMR